MTSIVVRRRTESPRSAVWPLLVDASSWVGWCGYESVEVDIDCEAGGLRRLQSGGAVIDEVFTVVEEERLYAYRHLSGLPVDRYLGEIELEEASDGGTVVEWRAEVGPTGGGEEIVAALRALIGVSLDGLVRAAAGGTSRWRSGQGRLGDSGAEE